MGEHDAPEPTPEVKKQNVFATIWDKFGLRTWADWRNAIHVVTPVLVAIMAHWIAQDTAEAIGVFVAAMFSPALAFWNSTDTLRAWVYGLVVPLQGVLVALDVVTEAQYAGIAATVLSIVSAILASSNTPTSRKVDDVIGPTVGDKIMVAMK